MTDEKLRALLEKYTREAEGLVRAIGHDGSPAAARMAHIAGMRERALALLDEGRREKAMRWLGFMQGVFYASGLSTVEQLKRDSMPDGVEYEERH